MSSFGHIELKSKYFRLETFLPIGAYVGTDKREDMMIIERMKKEGTSGMETIKKIIEENIKNIKEEIKDLPLVEFNPKLKETNRVIYDEDMCQGFSVEEQNLNYEAFTKNYLKDRKPCLYVVSLYLDLFYLKDIFVKFTLSYLPEKTVLIRLGNFIKEVLKVKLLKYQIRI